MSATAGPAVPPNEAVPTTINSKRLLRFSRPFQPSSKKGAPPAVAPRKWRSEEETAADEDSTKVASAAAATQQEGCSSSSSNNIRGGGGRSFANSVVVTKDLVEQVISKLNPIERDRALKGLDPIALNSAEAAAIRAERFLSPEEKAELERSRRFGAAAAPTVKSLVAAGANLVSSAPLKQQQQQQQQLRSQSGGSNGKSNNNQQKKAAAPAAAPAKVEAPLDEAAQKRLARFK